MDHRGFGEEADREASQLLIAPTGDCVPVMHAYMAQIEFWAAPKMIGHAVSVTGLLNALHFLFE
jgi:hypothetical protein